VIAYPPRLELARTPTPLERLERVEKALSLPGELWVKRDDLTGMGLSGNKVRKLEFLFADARSQGATAVVTCGGVQSNHARATALAAAQLGLKCTLILRTSGGSGAEPPNRADPPELAGNLLLDRLAGARVRFVTRPEYQARRDELLAEVVRAEGRDGEKGYAITEGGSDHVGSWGYVRALDEILAQDARWDAITFATGSGGTAAGLAHGRALLGSRAPLVGFCVCDDSAFFTRKVRGILERMGSAGDGLRFEDRYKGPAYAQADPSTLELIALVGRTSGLLLDPVYTGKAFQGTVEEMRRGAFGERPRVLFIHTGGLFGTLAQASAFERVVQDE
jgi:D-cysteine desulfhydrase